MPPLTPSLTRDRTPRASQMSRGKGKRYARVHGRTGLNPARATASTGSQQSESYAELKLTRTTIKPQYGAPRDTGDTQYRPPSNISYTHRNRIDLGASNAYATIRVVRSMGVGYGPPGREGTRLLSQRIVPKGGDWNASVSLHVQLRGPAPGAATPGS